MMTATSFLFFYLWTNFIKSILMYCFTEMTLPLLNRWVWILWNICQSKETQIMITKRILFKFSNSREFVKDAGKCVVDTKTYTKAFLTGWYQNKISFSIVIFFQGGLRCVYERKLVYIQLFTLFAYFVDNDEEKSSDNKKTEFRNTFFAVHLRAFHFFLLVYVFI